MILLKNVSCPKCKSECITYTAVIPVEFTISKNGLCYIESSEKEMEDNLIHEWDEGRITYCRCNYCGESFDFE